MKYLNDVKAKDIKNSIGTDTVYKSKNSGCFTITSYLDSYNIGIKFIDTGYEMFAHLGNIKIGNVKDPYSPSVYSVGILGNKDWQLDKDLLIKGNKVYSEYSCVSCPMKSIYF